MRIAESQIRNSAFCVKFRVEAADYSTAPPTDPYLKISLIRFLSSDLSETKQARPRLAHNFTTLHNKSHSIWIILG